MHQVGFLQTMPKNRTKHSNEERAVSDELKELEKLLQEAQDHAVNLEKEFDKYTKEVRSQTCAEKGIGCGPDKTDKKSMTDAQSSTQGWISWALSLVRPQETEPDGDQIAHKESEIHMQSGLRKNRELIVSCQDKLQYLSLENLSKGHADLEKQNPDLLKNYSKVKATSSIPIPETLSRFYYRWISPPEKQVTVQLYCQQQADIVQSIMKELTQQLKSHCPKYGIELKERIVEPGSPIDPDLPLMVICLHASRLGPDICDAIREIKSGPNVAVLIVHNKDLFALSTERSVEILPKEEYSEIGAIIDVAFVAGKGMYKCDINKHAIEVLIEFIKRKGIKSIKP